MSATGGGVESKQEEQQDTSGQSPSSDYDALVRSSDLFWEKLRSFHSSFSSKFSVPTVGGRALDLHHLFIEVTSRGGFEKVISDRKWKEVVATFNFPPTITSASFVLRKFYISLLYHFEQAYLFNKQAPSVSNLDANGSHANGSASHDDGITMNQLPAGPQLEPGSSVTGNIDGKFDGGCLVTVNIGSEVLKGVLYHIHRASNLSEFSHGSDVPPARRRKISQSASRDPSQLGSNNSGYEIFFSEHYAQLKPLYNGQESVLSDKIGLLWNNLTDDEKRAYEEKGLKEKERLGTTKFEHTQ